MKMHSNTSALPELGRAGAVQFVVNSGHHTQERQVLKAQGKSEEIKHKMTLFTEQTWVKMRKR